MPSEELESLEITKKSVLCYRKKLQKYLKHEKPFEKGFFNKTYILDMLYFMGTAIDEQKFYTAGGFNDFKKIIAEVIKEN